MHPERRERDPNVWVIDNGEDCIVLDSSRLEADLTHCGIDRSVVDKVLKRIQEFIGKIEEEEKKGVHLGSSMLDSAFSSLFWDGNPEELGLHTDLEQKLVGKLIEKSCQRQRD